MAYPRVDRCAATLYAPNTAGGLLGAGLANHDLVPAIGIQGTLILLASVCAAIGIIGLMDLGRQKRRWAVAALRTRPKTHEPVDTR